VADAVLEYVPGAEPEELAPGQCTVRSSGEHGTSRRWWLMWLCVERSDDGKPERRHLPVNPRGYATSCSPGWGTWGLQPVEGEPHAWQISPSIAMMERYKDGVTGEVRDREIWHKTPKIVSVPDDEMWTRGGEPPA
jgi:hypothetical protein